MARIAAGTWAIHPAITKDPDGTRADLPALRKAAKALGIDLTPSGCRPEDVQ
jgi:hypothetical protein